MTLKELREEVVARGAQNILSDASGETRINRWINQAIRDICDFKPWPFLLTSKEGAAPLKIEDLGHVEVAIDATNDNKLRFATIGQLTQGDPDLSSKGNAEYWYTEDNETVKVFPASGSATFKFTYRKIPADLTEDGKSPVIPAAYHDLIVDGVMVKVYKSTDNFEAAAEVLKDYERRLDGMVRALRKPNYDGERRLTRTGGSADYL